MNTLCINYLVILLRKRILITKAKYNILERNNSLKGTHEIYGQVYNYRSQYFVFHMSMGYCHQGGSILESVILTLHKYGGL